MRRRKSFAWFMLRWALVGTGVAVITLALATHFLALDLSEVFRWMEAAFGPVYLSSYLVLVGVAGTSFINLNQPNTGTVWLEAGLQASGAVATLALTFTLLGISLGIESLSRHELSPETIQLVITDLTRHFSSAFLTSIVGLPTANVLRALISIRWAALQAAQPGLSAGAAQPHDLKGAML